MLDKNWAQFMQSLFQCGALSTVRKGCAWLADANNQRCMQSKNAEGIIVVLTCVHLMGKLVFLTDGVNVNWMSMIQTKILNVLIDNNDVSHL